MPTSGTSRYQQLLDTVSDDESFVRQTFGYMEADLRTLALAALADWAAADLSDAAEVLFEAVGTLQRPAWGAWNGLLEALTRARRKIVREGDAASRKRLEQAATVQTILTGLERKIDPAPSEKLQPLIALARHQGGPSLQLPQTLGIWHSRQHSILFLAPVVLLCQNTCHYSLSCCLQ